MVHLVDLTCMGSCPQMLFKAPDSGTDMTYVCGWAADFDHAVLLKLVWERDCPWPGQYP